MSWVGWIVLVGVALFVIKAFLGRNRDRRFVAVITIPEHSAPTIQIEPPTTSRSDLCLAVICLASDILWILQRERREILAVFKELVRESVDFWDEAGTDLIDRCPSAHAIREMRDAPRAVSGGESFSIAFSRTDYAHFRNRVSAITKLPNPGLAANVPYSFMIFTNAVYCLANAEERVRLHRALTLWSDIALKPEAFSPSTPALRSLFELSLSAWERAAHHRQPESDQVNPARVPPRFPEKIDLMNMQHAQLVDDIRERYSALLMRQDDQFKGCVYRPASLLPYPPSDIRVALQALLSVANGQVSSPYFSANVKGPAAAETIGVCLLHLSDFIDVPAAELPRVPVVNNVYGVKYQEELGKGATVAEARIRAAEEADLLAEILAHRRTT